MPMKPMTMESNEIWKAVKNYEGYYAVSNTGKIYSFKKQGSRGQLLKQRTDKKGYLYVSLCKNGKYTLIAVHRVVAQAFIENSSNLPCVNHKDENKTNNNVENLEWCTYQYNNNYGTARERASRTRYKPCIGKWKDGTERIFNSCTIASKETGISQGNIWGACNGLWKTAGGVVWSYV